MESQTAWRITSARYSKQEAFSGEGALIAGGRWHKKGQRVIYTSENLALATLETYIHLNHLVHVKKFKVYRVEIPQDLILTPDLSEMIAEIDSLAISRETQDYGTKWLKKKPSAAMALPSVIVPLEKNILLNPAHRDFSRIVIHDPLDHRYDPRL